jgi:hypothetical protein
MYESQITVFLSRISFGDIGTKRNVLYISHSCFASYFLGILVRGNRMTTCRCLHSRHAFESCRTARKLQLRGSSSYPHVSGIISFAKSDDRRLGKHGMHSWTRHCQQLRNSNKFKQQILQRVVTPVSRTFGAINTFRPILHRMQLLSTYQLRI